MNRKSPLEIRDILIVGLVGGILSFGVFNIPGLSLFLLFLPLPYIVLIKKHGHSAGTIAIGLTGLINLIFFGTMTFLITLVSFGLVSVVLGGAFHEKIKPSKTLIISVIVAVVSSLILYYFALRQGLINEIENVIRQNFLSMEQFFTPESAAEIKEVYINFMLTALPGLIASFSIIVGIINYYLAAFALRRSGFEVEKIKALKEWKFPRWLAILFVLIYILPSHPVTLNIWIILMVVLMIEGVATIIYYGDKWGLYPWVRNILLFIGFFFLIAFFILGLIDNLFKLRGFRLKQKG